MAMSLVVPALPAACYDLNRWSGLGAPVLGAAEDMCMLGGSSRLSHSNICGVLPVEKINAEMKSEEKIATLQTVVSSVELLTAKL